MFPLQKLTRKTIDPRMPVLAPVHHALLRQLDPDIQLHQGLDGFETRAR